MRFILTLLFCYFGNALFAQYPNTLLWRISGNGLKKPSYLFGTMHLADKEIYTVNDSLIPILKQCDGFANELSPTEYLQYLKKSYDKSISVPTYNTIFDFNAADTVTENREAEFSNTENDEKPKAKKSDKNLKLKEYDSVLKKTLALIKPTFIAGEEKYRASILDGYLLRLALQANKKIGGLELAMEYKDYGEDLDYDLSYFTNENILFAVQPLRKLYLNQDINGIEDYYKGAMGERFALIPRNKNMLKRIDSLSRNESWLFTAGAAHLGGNYGLLELLKAKGYTLSPIMANNKTDITTYNNGNLIDKWITIYNTDSSYQMQMPYGTINKNLAKNNITSYLYASIHFPLLIRSVTINNAAPLLKHPLFLPILKYNLFNHKNVIKIDSSKQDQLILTYIKDNNYNKYQIIKSGNHLILNTVETSYYSKEKDSIAQYFFNSFKNTNKVNKLTIAETLTTETENHMHLKYLINANAKVEASNSTPSSIKNLDNNMYLKVHSTTNNETITLATFEAQDGYIFNNDSSLFENTRANELEGNDYIYKDTLITINNIPALYLNYSKTKNNLKQYINKYIFGFNNKFYSITQTTFDSTLELYNAYKNNPFSLISSNTIPFKKYSVKNNISLYLPNPANNAIPVTEDNAAYIRFSKDSSTGNNFIIRNEVFNKYNYFFSKKEALYNLKANTLYNSDTLLDIKYDSLSTLPNCTFVYKNKRSANYNITKCYYYGDKILSFTANGTKENLANKQVQLFFDSISIPTEGIDTAYYFKNKTADLLIKLKTENDSSVLDKVYNAIDLQKASIKDIPKLDLILNRDFSNTTYPANKIKYYILNERFRLDSIGTIAFIKNKFPSLKLSIDKNIYLEFLLYNTSNTERANTAILLNQNAPEYISNPNMELLNKNESAKKFFILELLQKNNPALISSIAYKLTELLDSGKIEIKQILPFSKSIELALIINVDSLKNNGNYFYNNIYDLLLLADTLNFKVNPTTLQNVLKLESGTENYGKIKAITLLLKQNIVNQKAINNYQQDIEWRRLFYCTLHKSNLTKYMNPKYKTAQMLAESIVYNNTLDEDAMGELLYLGIMNLKVKGKIEKCFCFSNYDGASNSIKLYGVVGENELLNCGITQVVDSIKFKHGDPIENFKAEFEEYLNKD